MSFSSHFVPFVHQPLQVLRWARQRARPNQAAEAQIVLPWGSRLRYVPTETIGSAFERRGIFDHEVCEALARLSAPDELAIDLGANIGQMSSVLACAVGRHGRVLAFEPNPLVFELLRSNVATWPEGDVVELHETAVSDVAGQAVLAAPDFDINHGSSSLEHDPVGDHVYTVDVVRLDDLVGPEQHVGTMKMDIEEHELKALRGAQRLLREGRIRDIVFEEKGRLPSPVTELLESHGYTLLQLDGSLRGPRLRPLAAGQQLVVSTDDPSLLATREPERALRLFEPRGWRVFG